MLNINKNSDIERERERGDLILKKLPPRQRTKPRTPIIRKGKLVMTFNVFGTPVQHETLVFITHMHINREREREKQSEYP